MKKTFMICVLIAGVLASTGCSGSRVKTPKEVFAPEEAFAEIPHSSFEAKWLEGGMKDEDGHVYEEVYDFVLSMDKAVIPYTVSGKLIQTCGYDPSEGTWDVERRTEDVTQEMDLTTYHWKLENNPAFEYTETFIKTGPNTFETGEPDHPTGIHFTVDVLSGGTNLKDESGKTNLPGGQWTARLYLESSDNLGVNFKGEAAIDLLGGFYGYNDLRWVVTIDELKRVEKELNTTDEERANEQQEGFRMTFPEADSFEAMDSGLAQDCNKELASSDFGDVGVDAAAAVKDRDGALMGWVVNAHSKDSYMGNVAVSVAFESSGTIRGLEFLELEDTPGLGMRAREDVFREQFKGKGKEALTVTDSGNPGDSEIDAISGATITSNAVTNAVNAAMYYVHHYTDAGEQANQEIQACDPAASPANRPPKEQKAYDTAYEVLMSISTYDYQLLAEYAHPEKGILFSPDPYVDYNEDPVFTPAQIRAFDSGGNCQWGYFCSSETRINQTADAYFDDYVYTKDYLHCEQVGINQVSRTGNCPENAGELFPDGVFVEYHDPGTEEFDGLDWSSLKIVMEEYEGSLKVVAIVNSCYTL